MIGISESVNDALTVDEMRAEINRLQFHDPMVRNAMCMANARGLSVEDTFVTLSYFALKDCAELRKQMLLNLQNQSVVIAPDKRGIQSR